MFRHTWFQWQVKLYELHFKCSFSICFPLCSRSSSAFCRKYMCKQWLLTAKLVSIQTSGTNATIANWSNGIQVAIYRLFTAVPSYSQSNNTIPVLFIVFCRVYSFLIFPIRKMNHNNIRLFVCMCVFSYSIINEIKIKCSNIVCYKWQNKKR